MDVELSVAVGGARAVQQRFDKWPVIVVVWFDQEMPFWLQEIVQFGGEETCARLQVHQSAALVLFKRRRQIADDIVWNRSC